jgi:hypothetical protein
VNPGQPYGDDSICWLRSCLARNLPRNVIGSCQPVLLQQLAAEWLLGRNC